MKSALMFLLAFCVFFDTRAMNLEGKLKDSLCGKEPIRILTVIRSISNNLVINTE